MKQPLLTIVIGVGFLFISTSMALAEFTLSVTPAVTRNDIHFGEVEPGGVETEEAELKVTNDTSVRYRITQLLTSSLQNEQGDTVGVEQIQIFIRNAATGTVLVDAPVPMRDGLMELYTSADSGTSDTMTLAYTLFVPAEINGGTYRGQVTLHLEPLTSNSSASLQSVTLNVIFEIRAALKISIASLSGQKKLDFGKVTPEEPEKSSELLCEIAGGLQQPLKIEQTLAEPLINDQTGELIAPEKISVLFSGATQGTVSSDVKLGPEPAVIYRSDAVSGGEQFTGLYHVGGLEGFSAGHYEGTLIFSLETEGIPASLLPVEYLIPVSLEVEEVLDFTLTPDQGSSLEFQNLKPGAVVENKVTIVIRNNTGQRYQLQQVTAEPLTNDAGEEIPSGNFEVLIQKGERGQPVPVTFQPVQMGTMTLYTSNQEGSGDTVIVVYRLTVPKLAKGGTYRSRLSFALTVI